MISAEEALDDLREGNRRFVAGKVNAISSISKARDANLARGQSPFAVVLACSDSRVPVELVFDQGFGELFVIRVAGNVTGPTPIGSIEFAVEFFGTPLVVVLGHSQCGAVKATLKELAGQPTHRSPGLRAIVDRVRPAVEPILVAHGDPDDPGVIDRAVRANIRTSVRRLSYGSRILEELIDAGKLQVIGAEYSIETGEVEFFEAPENDG
jgi:carbonic anhydrase